MIDVVHASNDSIRRRLEDRHGGGDWQTSETFLGGVRIDLSDYAGCFSDGWTSEDISEKLGEISGRLGMRIVCVWEYIDEAGTGGPSDLAVERRGCLYTVPEGLWAVLVDGADRLVDPAVGVYLHPDYDGDETFELDDEPFNLVIKDRR